MRPIGLRSRSHRLSTLIGIYADVLAMDKAIMERIRRLIVRQSDNVDREFDLTNLRLILAQLEKVGQRIAYWNVRLRRLVRGELSPRPGSSLRDQRWRKLAPASSKLALNWRLNGKEVHEGHAQGSRMERPGEPRGR